MGKIKTNISYTFTCDCGKSITVDKLISATKDHNWRANSNSYPITEKSIRDIACPDCVAKEKEKLMSSEDIHDRIRGGYYHKHPDMFRGDALKYVGLEGHKKVNQIWSMAWERGESHEGVLYELEQLIDLLS